MNLILLIICITIPGCATVSKVYDEAAVKILTIAADENTPDKIAEWGNRLSALGVPYAGAAGTVAALLSPFIGYYAGRRKEKRLSKEISIIQKSNIL